MNSTNTSNKTTITAEQFIELLSGSWLQEILYLALLTPISLVAFVLNFLSFCVILKKPFRNSTFYEYFRTYTFNNLIISALLSTTFVYKTYRSLFNLASSYWAIFYGCYIHFPFILIFYLYISLLEICIIIERVYYFISNRFKLIKISNIKKYCSVLFVLSILVNLSAYLKFEPSFIELKDQNNSFLGIYFIKLTRISYTSIFKIMENVSAIIRDLSTLLIKLILNTVFLVLIKQYMSKIEREKKEFVRRISSKILHSRPAILIQPEKTTKYLSSTERNQTYIAIIMCIFSLVKHIFCLISYIFILFSQNSLGVIFYYVFFLSISIESVFNILLLYAFNKLFRINFRKVFHFF